MCIYVECRYINSIIPLTRECDGERDHPLPALSRLSVMNEYLCALCVDMLNVSVKIDGKLQTKSTLLCTAQCPYSVVPGNKKHLKTKVLCFSWDIKFNVIFW